MVGWWVTNSAQCRFRHYLVSSDCGISEFCIFHTNNNLYGSDAASKKLVEYKIFDTADEHRLNFWYYSFFLCGAWNLNWSFLTWILTSLGFKHIGDKVVNGFRSLFMQPRSLEQQKNNGDQPAKRKQKSSFRDFLLRRFSYLNLSISWR